MIAYFHSHEQEMAGTPESALGQTTHHFRQNMMILPIVVMKIHMAVSMVHMAHHMIIMAVEIP